MRQFQWRHNLIAHLGVSEDFSLLAPCRANDAEAQEGLKDADHLCRAIRGGIEQMRAHQPCVRFVVKPIAVPEQAKEPAVPNIRQQIRRHLLEGKHWAGILAGDKPA